MKKQKFLISIFIILISILMIGCGSKKENEPNPEEYFFNYFESSINLTEGKTYKEIVHQYIKIDENTNPMATSLVENKPTEIKKIETIIERNGIDKQRTQIILSSSEKNIDKEMISEEICTNKGTYINNLNLSLMGDVFYSPNKTETIELYKEIDYNINNLNKELKEKPYIRINIDEISDFINKQKVNSKDESSNYNNIFLLELIIDNKINLIEEKISLDTLKQVVYSYNHSLIQYDTQNNYYYLKLKDNEFIEFYNKYQAYLNENLDKMIDNYFIEMKLEEDLISNKNCIQSLYNELQQIGFDVTQEDILTLQKEYEIDVFREKIKESISNQISESYQQTLKKYPFDVTIAIFKLNDGFKQIMKFETPYDIFTITTTKINHTEEIIIPTDSSYSIINFIEEILKETKESKIEQEIIEKDNPTNWNLYYSIVFMTDKNINKEKIEEIGTKYNANIDYSLSDIGAYAMFFKEGYFEDELKEIVEELKQLDYIEEAFIDYPIPIEPYENIDTKKTDSE